MRMTFIMRAGDAVAGVRLDETMVPLAHNLVASLRGTPADSADVLRWTNVLDASRAGAVRACLGLDALAALRGDKAAAQRLADVDMAQEIRSYERYKADLAERLEQEA